MGMPTKVSLIWGTGGDHLEKARGQKFVSLLVRPLQEVPGGYLLPTVEENQARPVCILGFYWVCIGIMENKMETTIV